MAFYCNCCSSGSRFEDLVTEHIKQFTPFVLRNIRFIREEVRKGYTECDIIFCIDDCVYIVEAKNVSCIRGRVSGPSWALFGSTANKYDIADDICKPYYHPNIIRQNMRHTTALRDAYYTKFHKELNVCSMIVVPNDCIYSKALSNYITTVSEMTDALREATGNVHSSYSRTQRMLHILIPNDNAYVDSPREVNSVAKVSQV